MENKQKETTSQKKNEEINIAYKAVYYILPMYGCNRSWTVVVGTATKQMH